VDMNIGCLLGRLSMIGVDRVAWRFRISKNKSTRNARNRTQTATPRRTDSDHAKCEAGKEALWLSQILKDFNEHVTEPPVIYEDNQSCIKMLQSEKSCHRTKHIATKYHFIRDLYKQNDIAVKYCASGQMTADMLTKPLEAVKLRQFVKDTGLV